MPNEFVAKNGIIAQNNSVVSGSLIVTNGITGSLFGTSSQAVSASFAVNYLGSGSISTRLTNTETTASNLVAASSSFSTRITSDSSSFSSRVSSLEATTASLQVASSSFSIRITNTETTASNLVAASSSFSSRVSSIEATTASLQVASGSFSTRVTQIERTYATTGSNIYTGSQNILGAVTASAALINGTLTAQTLVVTTVSSSVVFSSGSNIFGNSTANTQTMTGSLNVSGSATIIGRVTAMDLTGSLFGTASWATNFITASVTSASYAFTASSAISSSLSQTASFSLRGSGSFTGSFSGSVTASLFGTASQATSASYAFTASSATNAFQAVSSSFATTASTVIATVTGTNSTELVRGNMADNDQFRILVGGTATNAGFAEIATADDGTEPIYVRQYTGVFASLVRTATLLDGSGNTSFPGTVSATFSGNLTGTASFATSYLGSGSISTRLTNLETASANLTTASGSFSTRVTQIERTYATTGSNIFTGSQNILGAITASAALINGTITAQTLVVTTVSSSVVFSSGSNIFGNSTANTQTMTGSLNVSGSATIVGRVTATDLTGSLFGTASQATSASFASTASNVLGGITSYVPLWNSATTLGNSVIFQSSSNIGISTIPQSGFKLDVNGQSVLRGDVYSSGTIISFGSNSNYRIAETGNSHLAAATGNVGIGHRSPSALLHVSGSGSGSLMQISSTVSSSIFFVSGSGNIGIGTIIPTDHLSIEGSGDQALSIYSNTTGVQGTARTFIKLFGTNTSTTKTEQVRIASAPGAAASTAGQLIVSINNSSNSLTERLRIDENGNVGIGLTNPSALLHVSGSGSGSLMQISSHVSSSIFFVSGSGNVGIGTITPEFKLDVSGSGQARIGAAELGNWPSVTNYAFFGHERLDQTAAGNYALLQDSGGSTYVNASTGRFIALRINNITTATVESTRFTFTGSFGLSGSMLVTGSITGSLSGSVTGSLFGTASQATSASYAFTASSAISSSLAQTASFALRGSGAFTGSFSGSVTASLFGTASQATSASYSYTASSAISASYALTASFALNGGGGVSFPYTGSAQITGSLGVTGSFSVSANQGSSVFSSNADTLLITGSLIITGSGAAITGSLNVSNGITGSLFGTASQAVTASYALTASYVASIAGLSTSQIATGSVTASVGQSSASFQLVSGSTNFLYVSNSGNVGINNAAPSLLSGGSGLSVSGSSYTQLQLRGQAAGVEFVPPTGDTWEIQAANNVTNPNSFFIYNRTDLAYRFLIDGNGNVAIGGIRPSASLDVSGSVRYTNGLSGTGSVNISGSLTVTGSITTNGTITAQTLVVQTITSSITYSSGSNIFGNALTNTQTMTGSVNITGSMTLRGNQTVFGVVTVQSASFDYGQNLSVATGSFQVIASEATSSFRCAFFDYVMFSGSIVRAGTVTSTWSGSTTEYYENYTADLGGSTSGVQLQTAISAGNIQLQATASSQAWTIRSLIRLL